MRTRILAGSVVLAGVLALAACGEKADEGVATAGGARPGTSASATPVDKTEQGRRFAACMREHGVKMPDPEPGEAIRAGVSKLPKDKLAPALEACKAFLPNGGDALQLDPKQVEQLRALSRCMRDNGVEEFPEPDDTGKLRLEGSLADLRKSPQFQQALEKCRDLVAGVKGGGGR